MSRSLSYLRRGLPGIAFVGSLGFGTTQALAAPQQSRDKLCPYEGLLPYPYLASQCIDHCNELGYFDGVCLSTGCTCRN